MGDVVRLRQIVSNLLSNAIKFTDKGHVLLEVRRLPEMVVGDGRSMFRFAVHDTGIGIPEDKQPLLFEKFVQADSSITRVYGGTGLGLTLVKRLAEMMGVGWSFTVCKTAAVNLRRACRSWSRLFRLPTCLNGR